LINVTLAHYTCAVTLCHCVLKMSEDPVTSCSNSQESSNLTVSTQSQERECL